MNQSHNCPRKFQPTKNPPKRVFYFEPAKKLFQLGLFVHYMLAGDGIEFADLHFFRHGFFVFAGGVEMAGTGAGFQFNFVAFACHDPFSLNRFATGAQVCEHGVDAIFVNGAQRSIAEAHAYPAVFALNPELAILQVRQEATLGFVVGVRNIVPYHRLFAGNQTDSCHDATP
jgi:hypothetical protein